ncbi:hypothetical protein Tco_0237436 [Tanacetum coccineum]
MSGTQDENPPPPPPLNHNKHHTTISTILLLQSSTIIAAYSQKGENMIYGPMKMEHYWLIQTIQFGGYQNGNGLVSVTTDTSGKIKILPPKTAEEIVAIERERKARTTLLMAIPEDHLAKFHKMIDAKEMWNAIKSRFGGNDESKKMQKYILKQQFEDSLCILKDANQNISKTLYLLLGYKFLIMRNNTRESVETKEDNRRRDGWNPGNKDRSRTGKKEESKALVTVDGESVDWTTHSEDDENYALMACNSSGSDTKREQLSDASVEIKAYTQGLKKVEAQLVAHQQEIVAKAQRKDDLEVIVDKWNHSSKNLGKIVNYHMSASDKFGLGYGDYRYSGILSYENEVLQSVFKSNKSDPFIYQG